LRRHGVHTVLGAAWGALIWWLDPGYLPWFLPVVGALALSVPLSVYSSRAALGKAALVVVGAAAIACDPAASARASVKLRIVFMGLPVLD
jgi:hypothetical protein